MWVEIPRGMGNYMGGVRLRPNSDKCKGICNDEGGLRRRCDRLPNYFVRLFYDRVSGTLAYIASLAPAPTAPYTVAFPSYGMAQ